MHPYLEFFGRSIPTYGVMALLGCLLAFGLILWICPRYGADRNDEIYLIAFVMIFAVLGAKLLYQLGHLSELWTYSAVIFASPEAFLNYLGSGFVFYGGLIGGALGVVVYSRFFRQNAVPLAESFVPGIPLFHCFGRIGCFMAGCCYGIAVDGPLSVTFTESLSAPNHVPLLPIQLMEAGANLVIFAVLMVFDRRSSKRPHRPLQNFGLYLILYSVLRFVVEFFRGDLIRGLFLNLSTSQWISLILLPLGIYLFTVRPEKNWLALRVLDGAAEN